MRSACFDSERLHMILIHRRRVRSQPCHGNLAMSDKINRSSVALQRSCALSCSEKNYDFFPPAMMRSRVRLEI